MFFARPKPRIFSYTPRFYHKDEDSDQRIKFQRKTSYDPHQGGMRLLTLLILVILVSVLIWYLIPRLSSVHPDQTTLGRQDVFELN